MRRLAHCALWSISLGIAPGLSALAQVNPDAAAAFEKLIKVHREMPAVTIDTTLKITLDQGGATSEGETVDAKFIYRKDGAGVVDVREYTIYIGADELFVTHGSNEDEYFRFEIEDYAHSAIVWGCFGAFNRIPFPQLAIFWGAKDMNELYMELYADTPEMMPTAYLDRLVDGKTVRTLELKGPESLMRIDLDPTNMRIETITHTIEGGYWLPAGTKQINTYTVKYALPDEPFPDSELAFNPGDRQRVDMIQTLVKAAPEGPAGPAPAEVELVGREAPAFLLQTPEGELVDLTRLRGSVVVIDFWATWCGPCRAALPRLHEVAEWARQERLPVRVYAINCWEPANSLEEKIEAVTDFWRAEGHTLPVLMDHTDETAAAYGASGIPKTIIIGPDGVVHAEHVGFDEATYIETMKRDILKALEM